jgi:serine/threonine protein phosphatase 1
MRNVVETNTDGMTFAIGDLHGRYDLLEKAIRKAEEICGTRNGTFVVCGDFIDRGPESNKIIERLMKGPDYSNWSWITLMGNHEDMMLQCIRRLQFDWWIGNGGYSTLTSYGYKNGDSWEPRKIPVEHTEWLSRLPVYYIDQHRAFVHAGFNPDASLEDQNIQEMMWQRDSRDKDYGFLGRHVVHGHEQYEDGPILNPNKTNIDTFAWLHGKLALAVFDNLTAGGPTEIVMIEGEPDKRYIHLEDSDDEGC